MKQNMPSDKMINDSIKAMNNQSVTLDDEKIAEVAKTSFDKYKHDCMAIYEGRETLFHDFSLATFTVAVSNALEALTQKQSPSLDDEKIAEVELGINSIVDGFTNGNIHPITVKSMLKELFLKALSKKGWATDEDMIEFAFDNKSNGSSMVGEWERLLKQHKSKKGIKV